MSIWDSTRDMDNLDGSDISDGYPRWMSIFQMDITDEY